ncbi:MAG: metal ABC transporter ATP-binding protein [Sedimentisphaerales bacterium]|nr:metal ABC transporter ATP-binding protein [Sedimentisphaerales bacterium]
MTGGSLILSNVRVHRSGRTILEIERLEVPSGAFTGVIGENGAGKTTLLRVCVGLIESKDAVVRLDGHDLTRLRPWHKSTLRRHIGYVPQSTQYNAELPFTVREVVAMGRASVRPLMLPLNKRDHATVDHWIDVLGLSDRRRQTFRSLSGGEQQKVLIARAMAQEPRILMLDEPCANLDFTWRYQISDIVERLHHQTGITVLMVSHDTSVLPPGCGRLILLQDGRILADGRAEDVLTRDVLCRAYRGWLTSVEVAGRRYVASAVDERTDQSPSPGG